MNRIVRAAALAITTSILTALMVIGFLSLVENERAQMRDEIAGLRNRVKQLVKVIEDAGLTVPPDKEKESQNPSEPAMVPAPIPQPEPEPSSKPKPKPTPKPSQPPPEECLVEVLGVCV